MAELTTLSKKRTEKDVIFAPASSKRPRYNSSSSDFNIDDFDFETVDLEEVPISNVPKRDSIPVSLSALPLVRYRRVLKLVPTIPYVPITCEDGTRVYLRLFPEKDSESMKTGKAISGDSVVDIQKKKSYKRLLGVDFQDLRRQANEIKARLHMAVADILDDKHSNLLAQDKDCSLWVEKYKPKGYMDLLSEETVNHNLLHWLKLWDKLVFGSDYLAKYKATKEKFAVLEAKEKEKEFWKPKAQVEDEGYDEHGRPMQKVVLLHGPPGLGKTTAAHVVARHAGYNVIELNASDDRSVDIFRKTLDSTTESRSEMFQDGRPNCLIIDEIDGAPLATVDVLVNLISGKAKESGKNKNKKLLRRPVICICNDLYAPSLKHLRTAALVLQFPPISVFSLVGRIEEISLKENLMLDNNSLHTLAQKTECDIRSCLSTMQFLKRKNAKCKSDYLAQLGKNDKTKSIFSVWEDIFFIPQGKRYDGSDPTRSDARFHNVQRSVQSFGDYEKLQTGVFENYLNSKFRDSYFQSIVEGMEWNVWFEDIRAVINRLQNYSVMAYLPMYFVATHFLYSSKNKFQIKFPNSTVNMRSARFTNNFKTQLSEIPPSVGRFVDTRDAILDVFPSLVSIIQPSTIRPVPSQLWSPRERETLKNIVDIMIAYHLTYTQQRSAEGAYTFQLEPDIEELCLFPITETTKKQFPYAVKQLIAREVELEKMRQSEPEGTQAAVTLPGEAKKVGLPRSNSQSQINVQSHSQHGRFKFQNDEKAAVAKDFFGRPVIPKPISVEDQEIARKAKASDVWFRFKEGYSNAVRKNLKLKDFL